MASWLTAELDGFALFSGGSAFWNNPPKKVAATFPRIFLNLSGSAYESCGGAAATASAIPKAA